MGNDAGYRSAYESDIRLILIEARYLGGEMVHTLDSGKDVLAEIFPCLSATLAVYPF